MKIGTWLLAMMQPLLAKILVSLGFSVVTITGLTLAISTVRDQVIAGVNTMPGDLLQIFLVSGGGVAFGILTGAITTKIMLWQITSATKVLGVNPG
jgi:hypothetical protein